MLLLAIVRGLVASSGIMPIPNFIKFHPAVLDLKNADMCGQPYKATLGFRSSV
jgi:hypothetical protein